MRTSVFTLTGNSSKQIGQSSSCFLCSGGGALFLFFALLFSTCSFVSPSTFCLLFSSIAVVVGKSGVEPVPFVEVAVAAAAAVPLPLPFLVDKSILLLMSD